MKVLLYGGSGGVGKAIKKDLEDCLYEVTSISRSEGTWTTEPPDEEFDVFIYCAGVGYFHEVSNEQVQDMIMLNFVIPIALGRTVKAKHYIFIASNSAYSGFEGSDIYCATKHGILGFARALRKSGKKVSVVSPGAIDTNFWKGSGRPLPELNMEPEDVADAVLACIENRACIEELLIMPQRMDNV